MTDDTNDNHTPEDCGASDSHCSDSDVSCPKCGTKFGIDLMASIPEDQIVTFKLTSSVSPMIGATLLADSIAAVANSLVETARGVDGVEFAVMVKDLIVSNGSVEIALVGAVVK